VKVLIVEDNRSERELLLYMLEARFQHTTKFKEASNLAEAVAHLTREATDCVLLDLQLPDSFGKETYTKIQTQFPGIPVIIMTNTKDRTLAIELVRLGAADYVVKDYTDEESIFQRILIAIEKHKHSVRVPPEAAADVRKVESARARLMTARKSGEFEAVTLGTIETTAATADLTRRMFAEMQRLSQEASLQGRDLKHVTEVADKLQREILEGSLNKPSIKSRIALVEKDVRTLNLDNRAESREQIELAKRVGLIEQDLDNKSSRMHSDISALKMAQLSSAETEAQKKLGVLDNRVKFWVAILGVIGLVLSAAISSYFTLKAAEVKNPTQEKLNP